MYNFCIPMKQMGITDIPMYFYILTHVILITKTRVYMKFEKECVCTCGFQIKKKTLNSTRINFTYFLVGKVVHKIAPL